MSKTLDKHEKHWELTEKFAIRLLRTFDGDRTNIMPEPLIRVAQKYAEEYMKQKSLSDKALLNEYLNEM